jgi:hypothetical protein
MQTAERYVRPSVEPNDELRPAGAAPILRLSRTAVYALISVLERYVDPLSGEVRPLPEEYRQLHDQAARAAWRRTHLVVIPEWGAESVSNSDWRLSRVRLTAWSHTDGHRIPTLLASARSQRTSARAPGEMPPDGATATALKDPRRRPARHARGRRAG